MTRKLFPKLSFVLVLLASVALQFGNMSAPKPDIRIGVLEDGPWERDQRVRSVIQSRVTDAMKSDYDVFFPEEVRLHGDWKLTGVRSALDKLLADPNVDVVLTLGAIGSYEAATRQSLDKPVVAARVVAPDLLHVPATIQDGKAVSGVKNLSYVTLGSLSVKQAVSLFRGLVPFDRVTFLVMEPARQVYPDLSNALKTILRDLEIERIDVLYIEDDVGRILRKISADTEAVILTSQPQLPAGEFEELVDYLVETKLPSFTLGPKEDLASGLLFGIDTKSEIELTAERVGANLRAIAAGTDAGSLPVDLGVNESLIFNRAVAEAIGFDIKNAVAAQRARASQEPVGGMSPSMDPVTGESGNPELRRQGPQLSQQELAERQARVSRKVLSELARIPSYSAFDSVSFRIEGVGKITLLGYAMDPGVKNEAEKRIRKIEEVDEVDNLIEVLPNSTSDDRIRARAYAAIYGHPSLRRYAPGAGFTSADVRNYLQDLEFGVRAAQITKGPHPIHILVKHGHLALTGVVGSKLDMQIAEVQARSLAGVFSVQNHLQVGS